MVLQLKTIIARTLLRSPPNLVLQKTFSDMSIFVSAAQLLLWRRDLLDHNTSNRTPARFSLTWIPSYTLLH